MPDIDVNLQLVRVKVREGHEPAQPIPLLIKQSSAVEANAWATGDGSRVFRDREWAEKSMEMDTQAYKDAQRKRIEASRLVRATVVEGWTGWVTCSGDEDDYFDSVEALLERHGDNLAWAGVPEDEIAGKLPAWCFATTETAFRLDLDGEIDSYLADNHHEDARDHLTDLDELLTFFEAWKAKQTLTSYYYDPTRIIVIDRDRYEAELAEAKAYLASEAANG
ncbi:hypothetical protein I6F11_04285 [Ensifer sp. NBAIM29]|nr:hypothetical protein [Ensifer sp. NBAIM29]